jgi:hypothetical protein
MPQPDVASPPAAGRPCAVCGGLERRRLFRQEFSALSEGSLLNGYDVVVCAGCGFGFADGLPPAEAFDRYYARMSKYEYQDTGGRESPYDLERFASTADFVAPLRPDRRATVLDLGCAAGGMLAAFQERGYRNLLGLDPSPACAAAARRLYDIPVVTGCLAELDAVPQRFDLILLSAVLEHVVLPAAMLAKVRDRLAPDGLLFIHVPDATGFAACLDAPFQQFSTEHIQFFAPTSLANLLGNCGLTPLAQRQRMAPLTAQASGSVLEVVFRAAGAGMAWTRDAETEPALRQYIHASANLERRIARTLADLAERRTPLLVWGVGTHAQRLLATTRLAQADIRAFVDSNPHYQGKTLRGVPILAPAQLRGRGEAILISSAIHQDGIVRQIRQDLGLRNDLICLYGRAAGQAGGAPTGGT